MGAHMNQLQWDGQPGHYEVYYLTLTDPASKVGAWIRMTMLAPDAGSPTSPEASLWFLAMDPERGEVVGRKETFGVARLTTNGGRIELAGCVLDDGIMKGAFGDVAWDLTWEPGRSAEHVHPLLRRAKIAKTILTLPQADVVVSGHLTLPGGRTITIEAARAGQAHLWGSKHATRWAWLHCNDFATNAGERRPGAFIDGVSVFVPRFGRELGPNTPVVGRFLDEDFASTSPLRVLKNESSFGLTQWRLDAIDGKRRITAEVSAPRDLLVGVTYTDPDGAKAYCYNSEVATLTLNVFDKSGAAWLLRETLVSPGRAHFEYAQREPVPGLELHV